MGLMKNAGRMVAFNNSVKSLLVRQHNIFESLNIRYFGPVDGHDVVELVRILNAIKDFGGPKVLHIKTVKGKGFLQAENAPTIWHAPGLFDENTGQRKTADTVHQPPLYQDVFGNTLVELAEKNDKIVGVTPAMPTGCSMNILDNRYPDRMFDVGIAEGHAVTFSAGMAKEGLLPFCNIYSTFAQRAYDNIIHDVAIQKLNMVICLDRAGIVGNDGVTHHGLFDIAALRCIPNLTLASPFDEKELRNMLFTAQLPEKGTFVIRYPRGRSEHEDWRCEFQEIPVGKGVCVKNGDDLAVLSFGPIGNRALEAITETEKTSGKTIALYNMRFAKPLDEELLCEVARKFEKIVTIEDGMLAGGFGSAVSEFFEDNHLENKIKRLGVPDHFVEHGSVSELYQTVGLDKTSLCNLFEDMCRS
jgi:1-deoxy-D-xylulose-5-phosphate synthase